MLTNPHIPTTPSGHASPRRPILHADRGQSEDDPEIGALLDSIAADVHRAASAARDGVIAEFAARADHARRHLPRNQLSAALKAMTEARKAALALIKSNEVAELSARRATALAARRRSRIITGPARPQSAPSAS